MDRRRGGTATATIAFAVAFGVVGLFITWPSEYRPSSAWATWTLVVTAMTSASGAAFVYGVRRWRVLVDITPVRSRDVSASVGGMWLIAVLFGAVFQAVSCRPRAGGSGEPAY